MSQQISTMYLQVSIKKTKESYPLQKMSNCNPDKIILKNLNVK